MDNVIKFPIMRTRPIPDRPNAVSAIILILPDLRRPERYADIPDEQPKIFGLDLASGPDFSVMHFNCRCSLEGERLLPSERLRLFNELMRL